jgi:hypothetical protein
MKKTAIATVVGEIGARQLQREIEVTTKTIFCIALEGDGVTGVDWFAMECDRKKALGNTGATEEVPFEIQVPLNLTDKQITALADDAAWTKSYLKATEPP